MLYSKCGVMVNRYVNNKTVYLRNKMADLCIRVHRRTYDLLYFPLNEVICKAKITLRHMHVAIQLTMKTELERVGSTVRGIDRFHLAQQKNGRF